ncbi:MAG: methyltransferase domain-containing protein [Brevirhabdus sp.]
MTAPPQIFDRAALSAHRRRAELRGDAMFLHHLAMDEIKDRLTEVNRTFTDIAVVTGHPALWADAFPGATLVSDDDFLALDPLAFDLVVHAMALHWANDPVGQLVQCRNALRPDGLLLAALPGGQTLVELRAALSTAEVELRGGLSPRVIPTGDIRDLGGLIQRAGLTMPVADGFTTSVEYADPLSLLRDLRAMGETNAMSDRDKRIPPRDLFARMARIYRQSFPADGDRVRASFELVFLTGWAPDPSQPQPLRPGSAQARLADALGTEEFNTTPKADS